MADIMAGSAMHLHNFASAAGSRESDDVVPLGREAMQSNMPPAAAAASPPPMTTGDDCPPLTPPGGNVTPLWA
jgi:hypothetical protein